MPKYQVTITEVNDELTDIDVNQDTRDIAESIKEHIQEQFDRSSVVTTEFANCVQIDFEVAPRNPIPKRQGPEAII